MLWRALSEYEATLCPGCHQPLDECLLDESVPVSERPVYEAGHRTCLGCQALGLVQHHQDRADEERAQREAKTAKKPLDEWLNDHPIIRQARQWMVRRAR